MTISERVKNEMMVIKSLGVVYGDIGTSPIYTFAVILLLVHPTQESIYQILSMIVWTLTMLVTIQYAWLATSLSKRGEGGTVVLVQLLLPYLKGTRLAALVTVLGYAGISLMIGDGVITPAISILSAVEGINLIPGYENVSRMTLLAIAAVIAYALFLVQKKGVERVASAFGPIMVVWFFVLGIVGGIFVVQNTAILEALSPAYAISFIVEHPYLAFIILADVLLCATGGEALYADMGHLGRLPILKGWLFAALMLILNYFGQGAFLLSHPGTVQSPFFEMYHTYWPAMYVPLVILAIFATVIASQAMISGIFSVLYQAMTTRIFPHFHIDYTSDEMRSQIYIGAVNWFLFVCVVLILFDFKESARLAAAYGLSVAGAMSITGMLMSLIFYYRREYVKMGIAILTGGMSIVFFISSWLKIPHGGYWSVIIASIPLFIIVLYTKGQKKLYSALFPIPRNEFLDEYAKRYKNADHIDGTALFFARQFDAIPAYIAKTMFSNGIIYDYNIIVMIKTTHEPHGVSSTLVPLGEALDLLVISSGYMEKLNMEQILKGQSINERTIFYGDEEIVSDNLFWKLYAMIKELSPKFVSFYNFPNEKLIGVSRRARL